jgi:hypothetical protein
MGRCSTRRRELWRDEGEGSVGHDARDQGLLDALGQRGHGHVHGAPLQHLQRLRRVAGLDAQVDVGKFEPKATQEVRQETLARRDGGEHRDGAAEMSGLAAELALELLVAFENCRGELLQALAVRRELHAPVVPLEQGASELLFETLHRAAQGRRTDVASAARLPVVQRAGEVQKQLELAEIHGRSGCCVLCNIIIQIMHFTQ